MSEDIGEVSDGYHTFNELYEHRIALFLYIVCHNPIASWWSRKNSDGTTWDGWILVGYMLSTKKEITYHMSDKYIPYLQNVEELEIGKWDGHDSSDVISRLLEDLNI